MQVDYGPLVEKYRSKIEPLKLFLFDVDGVLTNGQLYYSGEEVGFNRFFHCQDGYALKILMRAGFEVGIISGGDSLGVKKRFQLLGVPHLELGNEDKREGYLRILEKTGLDHHQALYMGDEFFDLPILNKVGFSVTVPHASPEIRSSVDYTTQRNGGEAAVREVVDLVRMVKGIVPEVQDF